LEHKKIEKKKVTAHKHIKTMILRARGVGLISHSGVSVFDI